MWFAGRETPLARGATRLSQLLYPSPSQRTTAVGLAKERVRKVTYDTNQLILAFFCAPNGVRLPTPVLYTSRGRQSSKVIHTCYGRYRNVLYTIYMDLHKHLRRISKLGGAATLSKHGKGHYKKMSKKGTAARWKKPNKK